MPGRTRPNILLITSDQQHRNTLGVDNPEIATPNLDRLAAQGTLFERAYCPNPTCTPSRASLITGQLPSRHGAWTLGTKLPETAHTVGEDFAAAGWRTALVGKAHFQPSRQTPEYPSLEAYPTLQDLEFWRKFDRPFYGFDHVEMARNHTDEPHVGQHYAIWLESRGLANWRDHFRRPTGTRDPQRYRWSLPEEYHYDRWIAERVNALLGRYREARDPFFLWASFPDPHPSYLVPAPWDEMYDPAKLTLPRPTPGEHEKNPPHFRLAQEEKPDFSPWKESGFYLHGFHSHRPGMATLAKDTAVYYGMVSLMDKYVGRILDRLDELGLAENTLVVFTTDHGHLLGQHGLTAKGAFHYEDLLRLPFIVRLPGVVPAGARSSALLSLEDLAPTFLSFAGLPVPGEMTGRDQAAVWAGERESARDHVVVENRHEPTTIHLKTYIDRRWKITAYRGRDYGELFDLEADPGEANNLWDDPGHRELKEKLLARLPLATMADEPLWMPRIAGA